MYMKRARVFLLKLDSSQPIDKLELLKVILKKYYNIDICKKDIYYNKYGKPMHKDFHFNFSDSKNYMALIIGSSDVGIDIEYQRCIPKGMVDNIINEKEKPLKYNALYYWVCKEAYVKYLGTGINNYFSKLDIAKITKDVYTYKYIAADLYLWAFSSVQICNKIIELNVSDML